MKEFTLRFDREVSLETFLELMHPRFDIIIRQKGCFDLVSKKSPNSSQQALPETAFSEHINIARGRKRRTVLSDKELEILKELAQGKTYNEISEDLDININNLRYYIKKIYRILGVNSAREAVRVYNTSSAPLFSKNQE